MIENIGVREGRPEDTVGIETLYPAAFPDEDLMPVVRELLANEFWGLSLLAIVEGDLAGHVYFTSCSVAGNAGRVALLGPLAVTPALHGRGIGSALINDGFARLKNAGIHQVCVLGDPAYYSRFGFASETEITPPYPLPSEWLGAWQSVSLEDADVPLRGTLSVPSPWRHPALWGP